uniref:Uncharacterized protein n=1 Tax=Arundo donax TaxID=35708 RepID=A0A0A9QP49_ARUDO
MDISWPFQPALLDDAYNLRTAPQKNDT